MEIEYFRSASIGILDPTPWNNRGLFVIIQNVMIFDPKHKIINYQQAEKRAGILKKQGKKLVMLSGVFDIFHIGHIMTLTKARQMGDVLFVSLGSDKTVQTIKGKTRPIITEDLRASTLAGLEVVDFVIIAKEKVQMPSRIDFEKLLSKIKPHIFALGNKDKSIKEKRLLAKKYGAKLKLIDLSAKDFIPISSTYIEKMILAKNQKK